MVPRAVVVLQSRILCLAVLALLATLSPLAHAASPTDQVIVLDPACSFGNSYINFVGFTCLADAEMARNPSYQGVAWRVQGRYNVQAFELMHHKFNQHGIQVGNITYCSNFTVRQLASVGGVQASM
jgi:hypothetical protein